MQSRRGIYKWFLSRFSLTVCWSAKYNYIGNINFVFLFLHRGVTENVAVEIMN